MVNLSFLAEFMAGEEEDKALHLMLVLFIPNTNRHKIRWSDTRMFCILSQPQIHEAVLRSAKRMNIDVSLSKSLTMLTL